jgi:CheY-like chemotaxis protein
MVYSMTSRPAGARAMDLVPPLKILLVEDNPINPKVASRVLEKAGHSVTIAGNGVEALTQVSDRHFDLVLMDVMMPEMDGLSATVAIRAREQGTDSHLPIVALTANAMQGDREKCLEAGMDGYVSKPIQLPILFQEIAQTMSRLRSGA